MAAGISLALAIHLSLHLAVLVRGGAIVLVPLCLRRAAQAVPLALLVRPNQGLLLFWAAVASSLLALASAALVHRQGGAVGKWLDSTYGFLLVCATVHSPLSRALTRPAPASG